MKLGKTAMTERKTVKVEIVFPCHNRRELTLQCLQSLSRIDTDGLEVHTIIVDDGSTDGTSEAVEKTFPAVQIIKADGNLWFTEGTNVGVRAALVREPDYVLVMNDDQIFDSGFLKYMVETAEKYPQTIVGSLLLLWDLPHKLFQVSPIWETLSGGWRHWTRQTIWTIPEKAWEVEMIVGNCLLVPARAVRECGLMNSARYPNFGDAEYTPRLRKKGWRLLIEPRARVFCQPNTVPQSIRRLGWRKMPSALIFDLKHAHNLRRRFFASIDSAPNRLLGILAFAIFGARSLLRKNSESFWKDKQPEKPLAEIFASRTVEK